MLRDHLDAEGFLIIRSGLPLTEIGNVRAAVDALDVDGAGMRNLLSVTECRNIVHPLREKLLQDGLLMTNMVAVQCTLFKKTSFLNWKVALHQDLSVPVASKVEHPALSGWSNKQGALFVQPPAMALRNMLAVRLHLDPCMAGDGPLRVVPRSHLHGRLAHEQTRLLSQESGRVECMAEAGDLLLMHPLLLHASSKATRPMGPRRVLHFLFGPADPGFGLQWSMAV